MIELLFFLFLLLVFLTYIMFDGDMLAQPFIFCAMYTFSIGCALINKNEWELDMFSALTFGIILSGALIFTATNLLIRSLFSSRKIKRREITVINIKAKTTFIVLAFDIIFLILWVYNVYKISAKYGQTSSIGLIMQTYRLKTSCSLEDSMSGWLEQLNKIVTTAAYIYLFSFINNLVVGEKKKYRIYLVPVILYIIISLFSSNRLNLLYVAAASVTYYFVMQYYRRGKPQKSLKLICRITGIFCLILMAFYIIRLLVDRLMSENESLIEYITMYANASVKLLDLFLFRPVKSTIWGKETFSSTLGNLKSLHLIYFEDYIVHKEFRTVNEISLGNAYTAYRSWYADFGLIGVFLLHTVFALFYNIYYYSMLKESCEKHKYKIILYGHLIPALFLHSIDDCFYKYVFCLGFILYLAVFYIMMGFVLGNHKIKLKIRRVSING